MGLLIEGLEGVQWCGGMNVGFDHGGGDKEAAFRQVVGSNALQKVQTKTCRIRSAVVHGEEKSCGAPRHSERDRFSARGRRWKAGLRSLGLRSTTSRTSP